MPALRGAWQHLAAAVVAGVLLLVAFPPVGWWWAAPLGTAALLTVTMRMRPAQAWLVAAAANMVLFLPLLEWVRFLGVAPWLALCVLQAAIAALIGPLGVLVHRAARGSLLLLLLGTVGAVASVEAARARLPFGGLTWGRLAFGQSDGPLLPWASVGGAPLVGAAVVVVAVGLVEIRRQAPRPRRLLAPAFLVIGPVAGAAMLPLPTEGPRVEVAVVQGNVPRPGLDAFAEDLVVLDNHVQQTERLASEVRAGERARPRLVIWPENAADQDPRTQPEARALVQRAQRALESEFLLGAVLEDERDRPSNALLVWGEDGAEEPVYRKRHLVPFGEYLPLRSLVERIYPASRTLLARDFVPGNRVGLLQLNGIPLAVGTCFEVAFDDLARSAVLAGGELLVLPSNNASYGRSAQSDQQLAMARMRAVEHGRGTVVATTSGISALIRPDGEVVRRSSLFEPALLQASLPRRSALTVATRWGAWIEWGLALLVVAPAGLAVRRRGVSRRAGCR